VSKSIKLEHSDSEESLEEVFDTDLDIPKHLLFTPIKIKTVHMSDMERRVEELSKAVAQLLSQNVKKENKEEREEIKKKFGEVERHIIDVEEEDLFDADNYDQLDDLKKKENRSQHEKDAWLEVRQTLIDGNIKHALELIDDRVQNIYLAEATSWIAVNKMKQLELLGISDEKLKYLNSVQESIKSKRVYNNRGRGNTTRRGTYRGSRARGGSTKKE
jgi:hypothetical protein